MDLLGLVRDEVQRRAEFPVAARGIFLAHAGVAPLPRVAVDAIREFLERGSRGSQENPGVWEQVQAARMAAGRVLGCSPEEIALLGPTSLGLNLVANGLEWQPGDEVVFYPDDYPANVYPWTKLRGFGVKAVPLQPDRPGAITWEIVEAALTERTRLVALASCHFLSGYRVDVRTIGRNLRTRNVLFCVDAIQSLGAFSLSVDYVDFLSADSHKWLLGPCGAGVFYVRRELQDKLHPTLLGSWNVFSPQYVAQDSIRFHDSARRYESGTLNLPGILGMAASMQLLLEVGLEAIAKRILELRRAFLEMVRPLGYRVYGEASTSYEMLEAAESGILSLTHPARDMQPLAGRLQAANVAVSLRHDRQGKSLLRISPHFYNTVEELSRVADLLK